MDVTQLDLISTPHGMMTRAVVDGAFSSSGKRPRIAVETTHRAVIVPLVLAGAGATLLPRRMAEDAARLSALVVPLDPPQSRAGLLVWRSGGLSPAGQAFVTLVRLRVVRSAVSAPQL
jgi:LysR family carnitine catabolism transcriptional activator